MKRSILFVVLVALVFTACKRSKQQLLLGSWHAVKLENPELDSFFLRSQEFIDTMGKNGDAAVNMGVYGTNNMDSLRHNMQHQLDSVKQMQHGAVLNTSFNFRKDSIADLSFNGNANSARWHLDKDKIVMEDMNRETAGQTASVDILQLDEKSMKLKFEQEGSASIVTFERDAK